MEMIVALSESDTWETAKLEWMLYDVFYDHESPGVCLCGHAPIVEHCVLLNRRNHVRTIVGNVCVKKFMGIRSDQILDGLKRVSEDKGKALNEKAIQFAFAKGWVNDWEHKFLLSTVRKRKLSESQRSKRLQINSHVLRAWSKR